MFPWSRASVKLVQIPLFWLWIFMSNRKLCDPSFLTWNKVIFFASFTSTLLGFFIFVHVGLFFKLTSRPPYRASKFRLVNLSFHPPFSKIFSKGFLVKFLVWPNSLASRNLITKSGSSIIVVNKLLHFKGIHYFELWVLLIIILNVLKFCILPRTSEDYVRIYIS